MKGVRKNKVPPIDPEAFWEGTDEEKGMRSLEHFNGVMPRGFHLNDMDVGGMWLRALDNGETSVDSFFVFLRRYPGAAAQALDAMQAVEDQDYLAQLEPLLDREHLAVLMGSYIPSVRQLAIRIHGRSNPPAPASACATTLEPSSKTRSTGRR